ncbi:MAG: hypothetical protein Fur0010_06120 [Bdellovibrio sp.]
MNFKHLLIISIIFISFQSFAAVKVFHCHRPMNIFDPNFQQGSELYLDITYEGSTVSDLAVYGAAGSDVSLISNRSTLRSQFSADFSHHLVRWDQNYLSMVGIGPLTWGAYLELNELPELAPESLGLTNELLCKELIDVTTLGE